MSDAAQKPNAQIGQQDSDQNERLALAAVDAIQRLIAERNALRDPRGRSGTRANTSPASLHTDP
jgi:hypothetical protein